jgi:DNA-binding transcriptional LysR family regulator
MLWEPYRYFLAVAETGSLSAAARQLSVSQPTVGRQITELETRLNTRLFDRASHGYFLTRAGEAIQNQISVIETSFLEVEKTVSGLDQALSGEVSISATEGLGSGWLVSAIKEFQDLHPAITFNLMLDISVIDLVRGKADIALRLANPADPELIGRKVGEVGFGLYGAEKYFEEHGVPETLADLDGHHFISWQMDGSQFELAQHLDKLNATAKIVLKTNTVAAQIKAVEEGMGLFVAPHYMVPTDGTARRIFASEINLKVDLWLLTHRGLRHNARIRAVIDFLRQRIKTDRYFLSG